MHLMPIVFKIEPPLNCYHFGCHSRYWQTGASHSGRAKIYMINKLKVLKQAKKLSFSKWPLAGILICH
jgi:hypothetical protein